MHLHTDAPQILLILAAKTSDGLMKIYDRGSFPPGLVIPMSPREFVEEKCIAIARTQLVLDDSHAIDVCQEYQAVLPDGTPVYLAQIRKTIDHQSFRSIPELLRNFPADRTRVAYIKAWQVLMGGLEETTKAVSVEDVLKHLRMDEPQR